MNKHLLILGIVILLICVGLSGCNETSTKTETDRFVGTWIDQKGDEIVFSSNGTYTAHSEWGNNTYQWTLKDGQFIINALGLGVPFDYRFSNNDNTLTLYTPGFDEPYDIWTKQ